MFRTWLVLLSVASSSLASAAIAPVFRNPESPYTSGHANQKELKDATSALKEYWWFLAELKNQKKYWLPASSILLPRDFSKGPYSSNQKVFIPKQAKLNYAISREGALLLQAPQDKAKVLAILNSGTRLEILDARDKWLKVKFDGRVYGFIYAEQTVTGLAFLKKKGATYKDLVTTQEVRPNIAITKDRKVRGFLSPSYQTQKGVMISASSSLRLHNRQLEIWALANLKRQGKVWWNSAHLQNIKNTKVLESLSEREVFDIASQASPPYKTFVSAKGIYKSTAEGWKKLSKFKNQNHPIAIAKNGVVFIGSHFSTDHGETFEPYIHWTQVIKGMRRNTLARFQIQNIEIKDTAGKELLLTAMIKKRPRQLYTKNRGKTWSLIR